MKIGRRMIDWVQFEMQPTQWAEACSPGQVCAALGQRADDDEPTQWATERVDEPLGLCRPLRGLDSQTGRPTQGCSDLPLATRRRPLRGLVILTRHVFCAKDGSPRFNTISTHCPAGGCQSSILLPSGSMTHPNFPYSESSVFSSTSQPSSRSA